MFFESALAGLGCEQPVDLSTGVARWVMRGSTRISAKDTMTNQAFATLEDIGHAFDNYDIECDREGESIVFFGRESIVK